MLHNYNRILKEKSGVAIMSVMLFFTVMTIMLGALSISSMGNARLSGVNSQNTAAYYAAEAGITSVVNDYQELMDDKTLTLAKFIEEMNGIVSKHEANPRINLSLNFGVQAYANISFRNIHHDKEEKEFEIIIVSEGVVNGQTRVLETRVDLEYGSLSGENEGFAIKHAVLVRNKLSAENNTEFNVSAEFKLANPSAIPRVATFSTVASHIDFAGNTKLNGGKIELTENDGTLDTVVVAGWQGEIDRDNEVVDTIFTPLGFETISDRALTVPTSKQLVPIAGLTKTANGRVIISPSTVGVYNIPAGNYFVDSVDFFPMTTTRENSRRLVDVTINVKNKGDEVFIVTDSLYLGNVKFTGEGTVTIYVRPGGSSAFRIPDTEITFGRPFDETLQKAENPHLLVVYVDIIDPEPSLEVKNNSKIYGSFMFANLSIEFSNNTAFGGYFMTGGKNVRLSNNGSVSTTFYYVPNGSVTLSNNAIVKGAIIGDNATLKQNAKVIYDPSFTTVWPFNISSPVTNTPTSDNTGIKVLTIHRTTEK